MLKLTGTIEEWFLFSVIRKIFPEPFPSVPINFANKLEIQVYSINLGLRV